MLTNELEIVLVEWSLSVRLITCIFALALRMNSARKTETIFAVAVFVVVDDKPSRTGFPKYFDLLELLSCFPPRLSRERKFQNFHSSKAGAAGTFKNDVQNEKVKTNN